MSKESLWILENPKLHISIRVGSPAEHSVTQSIWKYDCQIQSTFERNIQLNILFLMGNVQKQIKSKKKTT